MHTKIKQLLDLAVANKASDLHLTVGLLPKLRINGVLTEVSHFVTENEAEMETMIFSLATEEQRKKVEVERELDFSIAIDEARFRVNMYYQRGVISAALRVVPVEIPNFATLNLPQICKSFIESKQGFVLVTGPTGHGKSTTVASLLNEINMTKNSHIVSIEDPVEYILNPVKSIISQREVPYDSKSFDNALRSVLRQDPNVVFVGEMRDLETISSALTIAETGHLVFSTLHTNSAAQTIDRVIDVFPEGSKGQIRMQLSTVLSAVLSQRLIPTIDGGRIPAVEVLIATPAVKNAIREGKTFMIDTIIQTSADVGMISLETSLASLVKSGKITEEMAISYSLRPSDLQSRLRTRS